MTKLFKDLGEIVKYIKEGKPIEFIIRMFFSAVLSPTNLIISTILLTSFFTIISFVVFGLGYTFLYGYFFGGDGEITPALLEIFVNPPPFNFYSVMIVGTLIIVSIIFLLTLINLFSLLYKKLKDENSKTVSKLKIWVNFSYDFITFFVLLLLFHFAVSIFFVSGFDNFFLKAANFAYVWIAPSVITIIIVWVAKVPKTPLLALSGVIAGIFSIVAIMIYKNKIFDQDEFYKLFMAFSPYLIFLISILFSFFDKVFRSKNLMGFIVRSIVLFPIIFIILIMVIATIRYVFVDKQFSIPSNTSGWIALLSVGIGVGTSRFLPVKHINSINQSNEKSSNEKSSLNLLKLLKALLKKEIRIKIFLGIITGFILLLILIPYGTFFTAVYVRTINNITNPTYLVQKEKIEINENLDKNIENGFIVCEKDGTYYISDKNWRLIRIKSDSIITETN